ncbi:DUF6180 family protein [Mesorhizobium sp. NPDC059054]|uniref:DUF6180 family protein n=1 Tax=Mesorhizobium sp. NPDC059054 TaxID=3346711 RepID=UPI0036872FF4
MRMLMASAALFLGLTATFAQAASDTFHVAYNVERADASKLSIDTCAEIARQEAGDFGYVHSVDRTPGQLIVVSGGPAEGGASFLVYCIAVDNKTAYVVQGIDYRRQKSDAGKLADRVHKALLEASK